ncbi:MAG: penicillin-binding transpeptidase domain-containing protein [Planctomycetota bacterium]|jgi:cell division protein FtsI/penicillin-binding protein 2|nr:penicillin-binding transpeptidase domain-containing protein [Planctomycetota bacterium]MDP6763329.1 penicillin-binding transpeptidase domain-containing protein [Planctomycetota bacterium]MDP6989451.1 penicillin-binding transpeptidase domain-containing protein [Planctomycetota bacterium]
MRHGSFESASGLRPVSAFMVVGLMLGLVAVKSGLLALDATHAQPDHGARERLPAPDFDITDRTGRTLARSVQRIELRMSPRAMWQAHTPAAMASKIAATLGHEAGAGELLARMLPDAVDGRITVSDPAFDLDREQAARVHAWLEELDLGEGMRLVPRRDAPPLVRIEWTPALVMSRSMREAHSVGGRTPGPRRWSQKIADGLARSMRGGAEPERIAGDVWVAHERQRARIWRALMPCADRVVIDSLPPGRVAALAALLDEERVAEHQMNLGFHHERVYPVRESAVAVDERPFEVIGSWRYIDHATAVRRVVSECCGEPEGGGSAEHLEHHRRAIRRMLDHKHPLSGLEGLCAGILAEPDWSFVAGREATYDFERHWPVHRRPRRYYRSDESEGETPRVVTTLDAALQGTLRGLLADAVDEHRPALAMGIAVDVASGDVLALDAASPYTVSEFLPTWHTFTPGSTFKAIVMAAALDRGLVDPVELLDTHDGHYRIPNSTRVIHEAEGPPGGLQPARDGLAFSINALLVQIGLRVDDASLHDILDRLGYGRRQGLGVGTESVGHLPALPWSRAYTHASVAFGHELGATLCQHAAGLLTVVRGGTYLPLRLVRGVERGGEAYLLQTPRPRRVLSAAACAEVRDMMARAAEYGTGRHLSAREAELGTPLVLGAKTGTAQKVAGEVCLHLELERNEHNASLAREDPAWVPFGALAGRPSPHPGRSCYTSSIALVGSVAGEGREVFVLVVVDEPRGREKFGSRVAGPAAIKLLKEALGLTRAGHPVGLARAGDALEPHYGETNGLDLPWAQEASEGGR